MEGPGRGEVCDLGEGEGEYWYCSNEGRGGVVGGGRVVSGGVHGEGRGDLHNSIHIPSVQHSFI